VQHGLTSQPESPAVSTTFAKEKWVVLHAAGYALRHHLNSDQETRLKNRVRLLRATGEPAIGAAWSCVV
jgi:hypothetical protein